MDVFRAQSGLVSVLIINILAARVHGESACPESVFGYVDPDRTAVVDSSVPPPVLADGFGFATAANGSGKFLYDAAVGHVIHYAPGLDKLPGVAEERTRVFNSPGYPGTAGLCILPGPPGCGCYVKTTYKEGCAFFPPDAILALGASPQPGGAVNGAGIFAGCEIESQETYCVRPDDTGAVGLSVVACEPSNTACPEQFFGYVDPDRAAVIDSSVPPMVLADGFGFGHDPNGYGKFLYDAAVGHVIHYAPGLDTVTGALAARQAFNGPGMPGLYRTGCIIPGPPPGSCGVYVKTVYKEGCPFLPSDAKLALGAGPADFLDENGVFEGCEVESSEKYCLQSNPDGSGATPCECPATAPESAMTCGDVKQAYKASKCCGNPSQLMSFSRRMSARVGADDQTELLTHVRRELESASKKSAAEARRLAAQIQKIIGNV